MSVDANTLYKLIILYMLDRVECPMTNAQISSFMLENGYTNYFTLREVLGTLIEDGFITVDSFPGSSQYTITEEGKTTVKLFRYMITPSIISDINLFISENKFELKEKVNTVSDYYLSPNGDYIVNCQVKENGVSIIDLSLSIPDEQQAESMCTKWKEASADIYEFIMKHLL